jgi:Na+/proline symporter
MEVHVEPDERILDKIGAQSPINTLTQRNIGKKIQLQNFYCCAILIVITIVHIYYNNPGISFSSTFGEGFAHILPHLERALLIIDVLTLIFREATKAGEPQSMNRTGKG